MTRGALPLLPPGNPMPTSSLASSRPTRRSRLAGLLAVAAAALLLIGRRRLRGVPGQGR